MVINFESDEEFQRLLDALAAELWQAKDHYKLYCDLKAEIKNFGREYSQARTFWFLTFRAHLDATLSRLARIYDGRKRKKPTSLSLLNLLDTINARQEVFEIERFRERHKNDPFVDSLASDARKPDQAQLDSDIEFASENNPLVKKLAIWRNNLIAHRNAENAVSGYNIATDHPLKYVEIEELVTNGFEILNRYKYLFHAGVNSSRISGHDDYKRLLTAVRAWVEQMDAEVAG
jgi:hypothetical protein